MFLKLKRAFCIYLSIFRTGSIRSPARASVLIFDQAASESIIDALAEVSSTILPVRGERYFLSPRVTFKIYKRCLDQVGGHRANPLNFLKAFAYLSWDHYVDSCIDCVQPRVVITFVDNYMPYYEISERHPGITFVAVQNGWRVPRLLEPVREGNINPVYYFCFGPHDKEIFSEKGHAKDRIVVTGSLRESLWRRNQSPPQETFDICISSQWRPTFFCADPPFPKFSEVLRVFYTHMARFVSESGLKCCIALSKSKLDAEYDFFKDIFGDSVYFTPQDSPMGVYDLMNASKMVVTVNSSSGREAMGMEKKVLFFDPPSEEDVYYGEPITKDLFVLQMEYEPLRDRIFEIFNMPDRLYEAKFEDAYRYVIPSLKDISCANLIHDFVKEHLNVKAVKSP